MKKILIVFTILFKLTPIFAQNLIPNPSFEEFDSSFVLPGPYYLNQSFGFCNTWNDINTGDFFFEENYWIFDSMDDDLFDSLSTNVYVGADSCYLCVPNNNYGHRTARTGQGYAGIRAYTANSSNTYKEFLKVEFLEPLVEDVSYQVSFYTCSSPQNPYSVSGLGAFISSYELFNYQAVSNPQIQSNYEISDTLEWTLVTGIFRSNGGENHICVGNFDNQTVFNDPFFNVPLNCLYYYIEDVSVFPYSKRKDTTICQGDTILLNPSRQENATILWQNGSTDTSLYAYEEGIYWMEQTYYWPETSSLVKHYDTIVVNFQNGEYLQTCNLGNDTSFCEGDSITLTATNPNVNYEWSDGSTASQFSIGQEGSVWLKEYNNCHNTSDTIFISPIRPLFLDIGPDTSFCHGESIVINISTQNADIVWNDGNTSNSYEINESGLYSVEISNHCESLIDSIMVTVIQPLEPINFSSDTVLCDNQILLLTATNPDINFEWSNGSTESQISIYNEGSFWLREYNECMSISDTIDVHIRSLKLDIGNDTTICRGDSYTLTIDNTSINILWNDGSTQSEFTANNTGIYYATISKEHCKSVTDSILISHYPSLNVDLGRDIILCEEDTIGFEKSFDVSQENASYLWQDGSNEAYYTINSLGHYWVEVSNSCETIMDRISVRHICECKLYFPSIFTPNNDGKNDYFFSKQECSFLEYKLQIFNRWGKMIYETSNPSVGWDGTYKNQVCPTGVYTYKASYQYYENFKKDQTIGKFILAQ